MSKLLLKNAMDSLQVKKPLRLPSSAPVFQVPLVTQVENPSQDTRSSLDVNISLGKNLSSGEIESSVQIQSKDLYISQDAAQSQDQDRPRDQRASQDQILPQVPRSTQPRLATAQDQAVVEADSVKSKLANGYTRIPNSILMELLSGSLSRNEMKLVLLIARMTISFNRAIVPLSKGVIERMTGIQGRAVLEAIQSLEQKGLIQKIPGDHNHPNRLGLVFDSGCFASQGDVVSLGLKSSLEQKRPLDEISSHAKGEIRSQGWGENSPYKKDNNKYKNNISLSEKSEFLRKYFENLKPEKKRESEWLEFEKLKSSYPEGQIDECVGYLLSKGMPKTGEPCHSPLAFLGMAIGQVLEIVIETKRKVAVETVRLCQIEEQSRIKRIEETQYDAEIKMIEAQFCAMYPNSEKQDQVLEQFSKQLPFFKPGSVGYRCLALRKWWEGRDETVTISIESL